jgi:hypothetical protein
MLNINAFSGMDFRTILTFALIIPTLTAPVFAQSCTDLATEIRGIQSPAFDKYPQLNDIKQDVLLILYSRERGSCPQYVSDFSEATKNFLQQFDKAYQLAASDISENHKAAVEIARKLAGESIPELVGMKGNFGVEAEDLVYSAQELIRDFLITQAESYTREAATTEVTKRKIAYYGEASAAYEAADELLEAANFRIKEKTLRESYERDMKNADTFSSNAESEYKRALELQSGNFLSKIEAYKLAREAKINFQQALSHYLYHHETERTIQVENNLIEVEKLLTSLRSELAIYFTAIAAVLIAISVFLIHRLSEWNQDTYDYFLGNELVQVSSSET